jgi:hypothetical protein
MQLAMPQQLAVSAVLTVEVVLVVIEQHLQEALVELLVQRQQTSVVLVMLEDSLDLIPQTEMSKNLMQKGTRLLLVVLAQMVQLAQTVELQQERLREELVLVEVSEPLEVSLRPVD